LIDTHGQDEMRALLIAFRDGSTTDEALMQTYGFDINGLEDQWRQAVGAQPRVAAAQPTAQPAPTFVPTIVPISGGFAAVQATATPVPTSTFSGQSTQETPTPTRTGPPLALTLIMLALCCAILLVLGVAALGLLVRRQNLKGDSDVK
jgi:hypothetical protein